MVPKLFLLAGASLIGGCAASPVTPALSADHPASANAAEAPYAPSPSMLTQDRVMPPSGPVSQPPSPQSSHEHHGMSPQPADAPGMPAMTTGNQPTTHPQQTDAIYTCPMHPEVVRSAPGRCPKCGMTLVKAKEQHVGEHQ